MGTRDPRVDAYIAGAPAFAKPILTHLRDVVHAAVPDVVEGVKWSVPAFDHHGPLCHMAAFKAHCRFGFWKEALVYGDDATGGAAGPLARITTVNDLPSDQVLAGHVTRAAELNATGVKAARVTRAKPPLETPPDLADALRRDPAVEKAFAAMSPSHRREYVEWIVTAKGEATRERRLATALELIAEGKSRHWKYQRG